MPSKNEIYDQYADEYDSLVLAEDYQGNLKSLILSLCDFSNKSVIEFGTGTGRLTKIFSDKALRVSCFDRSKHMLEKARYNLKGQTAQITFDELDHLNIHTLKIQADVVLEGWSFGHTVKDNPLEIESIVDKLIKSCEKLVKHKGKIILIETLGTNVNHPNPPDKILERFYHLLVKTYGYKKYIISTDYRFSSVEEAEKIMGFFFGEKFKPGIIQRNSVIIPEFTGVWVKTII